MSRNLVLVILSFVSCLLASCAQTSITRLPAFERSQAIEPAGQTITVWGNDLSVDELPAMVPIAVVGVVGGSEKFAPVVVADKVAAFRPDLIVVNTGAPVYTGSVTSASAYGGYATAVSTPVYERTFSAFCYRLSPVRLGARWDESGMVIAMSESCAKSGLLEGDKILSVNGATITYGEKAARSEHLRKMLELKPGDDVKLVRIRPGAGRMKGTVRCAENPPEHLKLTDVCAEVRTEMERSRD